MRTITGKINLLMLKGAIMNMKGKTGIQECLIIPIAQNHLFKGEKGVYLDMIAFELKEKKNDSNDTHLVKQSLPKEIREAMSSDDQNAMPIIGNLAVWGDQAQSEPIMNPAPVDEGNDLPF